MTEVYIPKTGQTEEAELLEWEVEEGQNVDTGDIIYRLGTDKVELDVEAPVSGVIHLIGVEGETYSVGDLVATIE